MKKAIRICEANRMLIQEVIDEVQRRASVRSISSEDVFDLAKKQSKDLPITEKSMRGIVVRCDFFAETYPTAYTCKGMPQSTQVEIEHKSRGWYLIDIYRADCLRLNMGIKRTIPMEAQKAIIRAYEEGKV